MGVGVFVAALRVQPVRWLQRVGVVYVEVFRNIPLVVLLIIAYAGMRRAGLDLNKFASATAALGLYTAAYIAEAIRSGVFAVGQGQIEASLSLGFSYLETLRRIVLPQAIRLILPPLAANFVQLIKYSSLGAVISVGEITRRGMELSSSTFRPLEIFTFIAVVYFFICWPLAMGIRVWEQRLAAR